MPNRIHPTAFVGRDVELGENNQIGPHVLIDGKVKIGNENRIFPYSIIGGPAQMHYVDTKQQEHREFEINIGNHNYIREFVTIHSPSHDITSIGDRNIFMAYSHIPHDAIIENNVKITNAVQVGGFSIIQSHAYLGLSSTVQQRTIIGYGSIVGMGTAITKSITPFSTYSGNPMEFRGINLRGLRKGNWNRESIEEIKSLYSEKGEFNPSNRKIKDLELKNIMAEFNAAKTKVLRG